MRILLLGNVRENQDLKQRITLAKRTLKRIVEQTLGGAAWQQELDLLCFVPHQVGDDDGVAFLRFENYAYILLDPNKQPSSTAIVATMLQVVLFFWFDAEKRAQFSNQFLFDLYKTGASLWLVNQLTAANWYSDDLNDTTFATLRQTASKITAGEVAYDENFWLDDSGKNGYFMLWFFGERVTKELLAAESLSWREIDQTKLEKYFAKK